MVCAATRRRQRAAGSVTATPRGPASTKRPSPRSAKPVTGIDGLTAIGAKERPPSLARGDPPAGIGQEDRAARGGRRADDRRRQPGLDLGPRHASVVAAPDVAAQTEGEHGVARGGDAEETPFVGNRERLEPLRGRVELEHEPALARDVDIPRHGTDRIQIEEFRIVGSVEPRLPRLPAVGSAEDEVVRADDVAIPRIGKPDVEERLVGPLFLVSLRFGEQRLCALGRGLGRDLALHRASQHVVGLAAVELQLPRFTTVRRVQHDAVVADGPAFLGVDEIHCRQVRADRDHRLLPGLALVRRNDDVAALADGDEPVAGARDRLHQTAACERRSLRGCVQHVSEAGTCRAPGERERERGDEQRHDGVACIHDLGFQFGSSGTGATARPPEDSD